jgi:hypothetical protein
MTSFLEGAEHRRSGIRRATSVGLVGIVLGAATMLAPAAWAVAPDPPTAVVAVAADASASVTWVPPLNDGGSLITSYTVTASGLNAPSPVVTGAVTTTIVTGLTNGSSYTFTVFATNADGDSAVSASSNAVIPLGLPGAPTNVSATPGNASAIVTWTAPSDDGGTAITSYTVTTTGPGAPGPIVTGSTMTSQIVTGLTNGSSYTFKVAATNALGTGPGSNASSPVTPRTVPGAPTNVTATAGNGSASLTWTAPASNGGAAITSYTIATIGVGAPSPIVTGNTQTSRTVSGLTNGNTYTFTVAATNVAGTGADSTASNAVTPQADLPGAPTNVSGTPGNASVGLSWTAPANDGGAAITSYRITTSGAGAPAPFSTPTPATSFTVPGLTNGSSYTFTVAATNSAGTGPDSTPSGAVTPRTVPDAPTNVTAIAGDASADLTWTAPASNGGAAITSYTITVIGVGAPPPIVTGNMLTNRTVSGLTNGNSYTFTVAATNVAGTGATSLPSNAVTPQTQAGPPTNVVATAGNASAGLTWTAPADNGGAAITSYHITVIGPSAPLPFDTGSATTSATVTVLTNGSSYTFTVAATNVKGTGDPSLPSNAVTPLGPPGAPTGLSATPDNAQVTLSWTAPAVTGGTAITSYTITVTGPSAPAPIVTGTTATSRVVTGLANGASYTFAVAASNVVGTGPNSTPAGAVPRTVPGAPTDVVAAPANTSAVVSWTAPGDNGGAGITSYVVTTYGPAPVPAPITVLAPATATSVGGLVNGNSYTFTVKAANVAGSGAESAHSNAVVPLTVPSQPTSVTAQAGDGRFTVSWSPPLDPGGSAISSYTVKTRHLGTVVNQVVVGAGTTSATVTDLTNGTTYSVTVSAANDFGNGPASSPVQVVPFSDVPLSSAGTASGYWMLESNGTVHPFGSARSLGSPAGQLGTAQAVDLEATPSGNGYWILDDAGRIFAYGDAADNHYGNVNPLTLVAGERASSLSSTPSGNGYWVFTTRGRAIAFGNARFLGDMSAVALNGPVLDSVATPDGKGYYMVASDGGIFAFGTAVFAGSMGGVRLNAPVQSLVPDGDGDGYWLVASDGGIFAFHAAFKGSMGNVTLNRPVTGMVRFGDGYLMVATDGGIFNFSDRPFFGSLGATPPPNPITAVAALES